MRVPSLVLAALAVVVIAGCAPHSNEDERIPITGNVPEEGAVDVSLEDYSIDADTGEAPAGELVFIATNEGSVPHELLVARFEEIEEVPTLPDGTVDEDGLGDALVGGTEELPRGESEQLEATLEEGGYVLFCNVDDHFERGMAATFTAQPEEVESTTTTAAA